MSAAVLQGFRDARQAIGTTLAVTVAMASWLCVVVAGLLERPSGYAISGHREPSLLEAATFGIVLPLASYALCARLGTTREALMSEHWARHGSSRRRYALGRIAFTAALGAALTISSAVLAFALSRVVLIPAPAGGIAGLAAIIAVAALGAVGYAAGFSLAQLVGGIWGRTLFLALDWALGSSAGVAALPWPRAHLRSLLGGPAVLGMSAAQAAQFLVCLALVSALVYARRVPP
jgi:hypothetical protein